MQTPLLKILSLYRSMSVQTETNTKLDREANRIARSLTGEFAWPTVFFGVAIAASYMSALYATLTSVIPLFIGYLLLSLLTYAIYTVMHDAVHGSIKGKHSQLAWINSLLGYVAGQILFIPFKIHQQEHLAHHRNTNTHDKDPDLFVSDDSLKALLVGSLKAVYTQYTYYFSHSWHKANTRDKAIVFFEAVVMVSWRLAIVAAGFGLQAFVLFICSTLTGLFFLVVLFVWLVHRPYGETQRYKNTNTFLPPSRLRTVITWLWLFQNYHSVHHLFPRVPFYRYRALFEKIEPIMIAHQAPIIRL